MSSIIYFSGGQIHVEIHGLSPTAGFYADEVYVDGKKYTPKDVEQGNEFLWEVKEVRILSVEEKKKIVKAYTELYLRKSLEE